MFGIKALEFSFFFRAGCLGAAAAGIVKVTLRYFEKCGRSIKNNFFQNVDKSALRLYFRFLFYLLEMCLVRDSFGGGIYA